MSRPLWFVDLLKRAYRARFLMAKATRVPGVREIADWLFFARDDLMYLPQDRVIPVRQNLESPEGMVLPSQVVDHFIEQAEVHWVMHHCICRQSERCEDYPVDLGCLFLGDAALGINPALGRRVSRQEALDHVAKCRRAGLVHLVGRNKLDTIWLGIGPGDKLLTICNCCPCCCLWSTLPHLDHGISSKITAMPGVTVTVNGDCTGCGVCLDNVCFVQAIHLVDGYVEIGDECRVCGRCAAACPTQAIEVRVHDERFVAQSIARLAPLVDLS